MADAIVSVVLEQLASIARQQIEQEVTLVWGASKKVKRLANSFQAVQDVLVDADQRQVKERAVRGWLDRLKDVSYDAENVLDEWNTSKLKLQIQRAENALTLKKKVCSFFLSPCFSFRKVVLHCDIALRIKNLNESLDDIAKDKERYKFNTISSVEQPRGEETTSFIDEYTVRGRDKETNALISNLFCESSNEHVGFRVISIEGMGGIGKTTLAQLAFNNNEVKNNFEKRIWVCVSDPFDKLQVANAIIQGLEGQGCSSSATLESVLQSIHQSIAGKKILLVLDDVWTENSNDWEQLYNCLKNCLNGSKIVVTTRKETVAIMMNSIVIPITELSENECWSLFKHFSFIGRSDDECRELENVGKEIVSKCKGLPLAAKTMGSLLCFKRTRKEWENILNSGMWELEEFEKGIFPPLLLSYNDLPLMVKRCFSYCVIFPKDYQLHKDELIKLWMAQGYLGLEQKKEMVMIGEKYFNILVARSFFQEFVKDDIGGIVGCKMHDIVHDFGQCITKNECFAMKDKDFGDSSINFSFEKARHLILMVDENSSFPISICNIKNLRSLLIQNLSMNSFDGVLLKFLGQNTCLRALAMGGTSKFDTMMTDLLYLYPIKLERIPKEIRKLIHLRYLDLSKNDALEMLPEELCELFNLQTLNVSRCNNLKELPQGMGKLINLRHLVNYYTDSLRYMPKGIEKLTCLQTLSQFRVSGSDHRRKACSLDFLNQFCHLEGYLFIKGLGNVTNVSNAQRIQLKNKKNIFELELGFGGSNSVNNEAIIEALQPSPNLHTLTISEFAGSTVLPNWITSLTNLRSISLVEWINCEQLPPLGKVSSLESIVIHEMKRVKRVGIEILGLESDGIALSSSSSSVSAFPKLKSLRFVEMEEWEEWDFGIEDDNITIMPSLRLLQIKYCPKLKVFPKKILQMTPLEVLSMYGCPILSERYRKGTGENWSDISHIPNIKIDDEYVQRDGR